MPLEAPLTKATFSFKFTFSAMHTPGRWANDRTRALECAAGEAFSMTAGAREVMQYDAVIVGGGPADGRGNPPENNARCRPPAN